MIRAAMLAAMLTGCASTPPDCPPPEVVKVPERVEIPVAVPRVPPASLLAPLEPAAVPAITEGAGDYCVSRDGMEILIDATSHLRERFERCQAWAASPGEGDDGDH